MSVLASIRKGSYNTLLGNVAARVGALVSLSLGTLIVARHGGPTAVGIYALLRVFPSLVGVTISCGLPGATAYFLAGSDRANRRLPLTIASIALIGGCAGALVWAGAAPLLQRYLFSDLTTTLVVIASFAVITRVLVATAKSCSQGTNDLRGSNRVIVTEELMFLPVYGTLWFAGARSLGALVAALLIADVLTASLAWGRLVRRGFFAHAARPSVALARRIAGYGWRAQIGGFVMLLNLRLDFVLISVMTGPAVLGVYAIASKYAELVKVLSLALSYVLYPKFAAEAASRAAKTARRMLPIAGGATAAMVIPLWIAAPFVIPALYGEAFHAAVTPAEIILLGLVVDGVGGVITGFLYGVGRPGLNSIAMSFGLVVTLVLDLLLIKPFGATGAATASAAAYLTTTAVLVWFFWKARGPIRVVSAEVVPLSGLEAP
ncbi:MAG: oligosaccharide flippase family protein [Gaiellaceae bacterium]